jgi:hypothetical protein
MADNRLFSGETGFAGPPEPRLLMLNNREFFPRGPGFAGRRFTGMIIDNETLPAGWAGAGSQDRERGG